MSVSHDSVRPTVATALAPSLETKNTSHTANTLSMIISNTIGMARSRMARETEPSVKSRCDPRSASRMESQMPASLPATGWDNVSDIDGLLTENLVGKESMARAADAGRNRKGGTDRGAALGFPEP